MDDSVEITRPITDDFTLSLWISPSRPSPVGTECYHGHSLIWSDMPGSRNDFILALLNDKPCMFTGGPDTSVLGSTEVITGQWAHLAATRSKATGEVTVYLNGVLENTARAGSASLDANDRVYIGANTWDRVYFEGAIDDVRLYDRVLTEADIWALYSQW